MISFTPQGDLGERLECSFDRLESPRYAPTPTDEQLMGIFRGHDYDWPGDTEGRAMLAWVLLEQVTGRTAHALPIAAEQFDRLANEQGYFGHPLREDALDEQQLAGHGWVLRALSEQAGSDAIALERLRRIVENLALPTRGAYAGYPLDPAQRSSFAGGVIGEAAETIGRWRVSSDVGCIFIFFDGLAHAASVLDRADLDDLVEEMVDLFRAFAPEEIGAQTHATLTGVRGLLRWYQRVHRPELLELAISTFRLYLDQGMSASFANWNWFGRPTHTEPCAIVDSFLIACQLWEATDEPEWMSLAHEIYTNGLGHAQRNHGGFGCDSVLGAGADPSTLSVILDEAWWCCTMRGAEGLTTAARFAVVERGSEVVVLFPFSGTLMIDGSTWECISPYPSDAGLRMRMVDGAPGSISLFFFVPPGATAPRLSLNGVGSSSHEAGGFIGINAEVSVGDEIEFSFSFEARWQPVWRWDDSLVRVLRGPMMYGVDVVEDAGTLLPGAALEWNAFDHTLVDPVSGTVLRPLADMRERDGYDNYARRSLFAFSRG